MSRYDESVDRILTIEYENIRELMDTIDRDVLAQVIDRLLTVKENGRKVITAGCGTSGTLARRVAHSFNVVEIPSFFVDPSEANHGGLGAVQKDDTVILFSKGGNSGEIVSYIPICRKKGAFVIGVSQYDDSILATQSDIYLKLEIRNEADMWNMLASASCNAIAAVFDAIAFTAMRYNGYTKEDLKLIHSGGKVGEILEKAR